MKNRIVKKILRIILLVLVGAAVIGTFYFLWKKAQPVITVYEIVTPEKGDESILINTRFYHIYISINITSLRKSINARRDSPLAGRNQMT